MTPGVLGYSFRVSYDLDIASHIRPSEGDLVAYVASRPGLSMSGSFDDGEIQIVRSTARAWDHIASVFPPDAILELKDIPEELAEAVRAPRWLTSVSTPLSSPASVMKEMMGLVRHLASRWSGAVFDRQQDAVIFPGSGRPKPPPNPRTDVRIPLVHLAWFFEPSMLQHVSFVSGLLSTLRKALPEALPERFGRTEPLQHRFHDGANEGEFIRRCLEPDRFTETLGRRTSWTARSPCFGGDFYVPPEPTDPRSGLLRPGEILIEVDGRALVKATEWNEATVTLFEEVAARMGAFYAAGYVQRNVLLDRGKLWLDGFHEQISLVETSWIGIPSTPTWLAWFGEPYRGLVGAYLPKEKTSERPEGLMLRMGQHPMDADQLEPAFPRLPEELVGLIELDPAPPGAVSSRTRKVPAARIPEI